MAVVGPQRSKASNNFINFELCTPAWFWKSKFGSFFKNIDEHIKLSRKRAPESRKAKVLGYEKQLDEENIAARWKWLEKLWKPDYPEAFVFIENLYKGVIGIDTDSSTFFSNKSL